MITSLNVTNGIVSWTSSTTPAFWLLEQCFSDGTYGLNGCIIDGAESSYDPQGTFKTGYNLRIWGLDSNENLILLPFISTDVLI